MYNYVKALSRTEFEKSPLEVIVAVSVNDAATIAFMRVENRVLIFKTFVKNIQTLFSLINDALSFTYRKFESNQAPFFVKHFPDVTFNSINVPTEYYHFTQTSLVFFNTKVTF